MNTKSNLFLIVSTVVLLVCLKAYNPQPKPNAIEETPLIQKSLIPQNNDSLIIHNSGFVYVRSYKADKLYYEVLPNCKDVYSSAVVLEERLEDFYQKDVRITVLANWNKEVVILIYDNGIRWRL